MLICIVALVASGPSVGQNLAIAAPKREVTLTAEMPIIFAASNDNSPPLAEFRENKLTNGILKDIGDAIAAELHRKADYVVLPRKRLDEALKNGMVDGVCYYRPEWVTVPLNWSQTLIPNEILLVSGHGMARPSKLDDIAGRTIGLVLGYKYPELDALGNDFRREDAPSMLSNTRKLMAGRIQYAVIDRLSLEYQEKLNPQIEPFSFLTITKIQAACGFSLVSKIPFREIKRAVNRLVNEGAVERILAQYR